ncbi:MAG: adenylate/guanylate cyclase domain-containing protein [Roseibium sp.]
MRLTLRKKLLLFSVFIAILPLLIAGQTLIRIAQDELKSSANDQLTQTARQVSEEIDSVYRNAWRAPLSLIANAVNDESLNIDAIIALLTLGIADLPDIVALQITVEGSARPLLVSRDLFSKKLADKGRDPKDVLSLSEDLISQYQSGKHSLDRRAQFVAETGDWLATIIIPLKRPLNGRSATLSARINLERVLSYIDKHAFSKSGTITLVNGSGQKVLTDNPEIILDHQIVEEAVDLLALNSNVISVKPYVRPDGEVMLGAMAFPRPFDWVVIAEKSEKSAYFTIDVMTRSLLIWVGAGLAVAGIGAIFFSLGISRPILKIGQAALAVGNGNFQARVEGVKSRDEIGELAQRINEMIVEVNERFQLKKFVSHETLSAIQHSDQSGVQLGGSRKRVAILFADIRGYTAFSEDREPEVVVDVLNHYFADQGAAVERNNGDIDKFVGDQLMAVFKGPQMCIDAMHCADEIQEIMEESGRKNPDWQLDIGIGIDVGEVVVGAMGSPDRMDYTVLGDNVNLAARLCSAADPKQTIISDAVYQDAKDSADFEFRALEPIRVKGKAEPNKIFAVTRSISDSELKAIQVEQASIPKHQRFRE